MSSSTKSTSLIKSTLKPACPTQHKASPSLFCSEHKHFVPNETLYSAYAEPLLGKLDFAQKMTVRIRGTASLYSQTQYSSSDSKPCILVLGNKTFEKNLAHQLSHPSGEKGRGRLILPRKQRCWPYRQCTEKYLMKYKKAGGTTV